jgi:hypothetical protein
MDPLFERRKLTKNVHIHSKFLQKNIQASLLAQLKMSYEGRCLPEGFIARNSITILNYSVGRANYIKGGVDYSVEFQADICMPHAGQKFRAPVKLRSKIGIHAETPPIKILIPRDLHLGNEEFEQINVNDEVDFEVVGSQFKQEDDTIIVVGKLLTKVKPAVERPLLASNIQSEEPKTLAITSSGPVESGSEKRVVITGSTEEKPKKRRLKKTEGGNDNEQLLTF